MKYIAGALVAGFLIGVGVGEYYTSNKHEALARKLAKATADAQIERDALSKKETDKYYDLYHEILNAEPVIDVRRVYVRAKCPVPTTDSGSVDNEALASRVELGEGVVRSLRAVAKKYADKYKLCAVQLSAAQAKLK